MTLYLGDNQVARSVKSVSITGTNLPEQTGNEGKYLATNGTEAYWGNPTELVESELKNKVSKTHVTNCITEIPQDVKMTITSEVGDIWYAWVSYVYGYILYSKTETVVEGDELYSRDNYGNYNAVRTIGIDVTIDSETRLIDETNVSIPLIRDTEYDRGELYYDLILKADSKLYFPAGFEGDYRPFNIITTSEDIKFRNNSKNDGRYFIFYDGSKLFLKSLNDIIVVENLPSENVNQFMTYYDLHTNKLYNLIK